MVIHDPLNPLDHVEISPVAARIECLDHIDVGAGRHPFVPPIGGQLATGGNRRDMRAVPAVIANRSGRERRGGHIGPATSGIHAIDHGHFAGEQRPHAGIDNRDTDTGPVDAARVQAIGADPDRIERVGNLPADLETSVLVYAQATARPQCSHLRLGERGARRVDQRQFTNGLAGDPLDGGMRCFQRVRLNDVEPCDFGREGNWRITIRHGKESDPKRGESAGPDPQNARVHDAWPVCGLVPEAW